MPSTLTKKARLSSGFGVNISRWPKWAKSIIGSGMIGFIQGRTGASGAVQGGLPHLLLRFAGAAVFGRTAENLAAVRQDDLTGVGGLVVVLGAETFDRYLVAHFERIPCPTHAGQSVRRAVLALPMLRGAALVGHIHVNPDVRVRPFHLRHGPLQRHRLLDIELGRKGVMSED